MTKRPPAPRWADGPSSVPDHPPPLIWSAPAGGRHSFVRLIEPPLIVWTHWYGGRTVPCLDRDCPHCGSLPAVRKGYSPGLVFRSTADGKGSWDRKTVELTRGALDQLRTYEVDHGPFVGLVFDVSREGPRRNGPITWKPLEKPCRDTLPEPWDVTPSLLRAWGWADQPADQPKILPFQQRGTA